MAAANRKSVLLIVDMLSTWDFEGADRVAERAEAGVRAIVRIRSAVGRDLHVAFANDLDGGFHGSREIAFRRALGGRRPDLVESLEPERSDDFIHKGQHSAFYGTPLAHLLVVSGAEHVILTGQLTEQCILYTALDAHVRGYGITIPVDAVISGDPHLGKAALEMIESNMGGRLAVSDELIREVQASRSAGSTSSA